MAFYFINQAYLISFHFFRSTGFVLEGFPRTTDEAEFMQEAGLFPDAAIILIVENTDVEARLLPPKLDKWRQKRDRKLERRQKAKERKQKKRVRLLLVAFYNYVSVLKCLFD